MTSFLRNSLAALLLVATSCIVPSKPPPRIEHAMYPMGRINRFHSGRGLWVGAATIDLTPPEGAHVWLAGYGFQRRMEVVRDPISARAIYFDDGERRVALVVADVVGLFVTTTDRVRRLVGNGIEVVVASTHNHQSPDTMGYWGPAILYAVPVKTGIDPAYQSVFERRLAVAVKKAAESARPVELYAARAELSDGLVRNLREAGAYDRAIEVVEARRRDGSVVTTLVNFGCHPETLGDRSTALTADFPGVLRRIVEDKRGGVAVFANGVLGGMITPDIDASTELADRKRFMVRLGETTGRIAAEAAAAAKRIDVDRVAYRSERIHLPIENDLFRYITRVGLVEPRPLGKDGAFETEVGLLTVGPLAWAFVPGEPSPAVGLAQKAMLEAAGFSHPMVVGLGNDELGYLLTPEQFDDEAYAYEASVSPGRDAGTVVTETLERLTKAPEASQ